MVKQALAVPFYYWQLGVANLAGAVMIALVAALKG